MSRGHGSFCMHYTIHEQDWRCEVNKTDDKVLEVINQMDQSNCVMTHLVAVGRLISARGNNFCGHIDERWLAVMLAVCCKTLDGASQECP